MARPRVLRLNGGEVVLKNFSKEEADALISLITNTNVAEEDVSVPTENDGNGTLSGNAISYQRNSDSTYSMVVVKYNAETREARVVEVTNVGKERREAVYQFKVLAANNSFV